MPLLFSLGSDIAVAVIFSGLLYYLFRVTRARSLWGAVQYGAGHLFYSMGSLVAEVADGHLESMGALPAWATALSAAVGINIGGAMMLHGLSRLFGYRMPGLWHKASDMAALVMIMTPVMLYRDPSALLSSTDISHILLVGAMALFMFFIRQPPYRKPALAVAIACVILFVLYTVEPLLDQLSVVTHWLAQYDAWAALDLALWMTINYCLLMLASFRAMRAFVRGARQDPLTDVLNRLGFENAHEKMQITARPDDPIAVITLDLDHFKQINDRWMHEGGDAVLKAFSRTVEGCIRRTDVFARFGGEEFVVLLPGATREVAVRIAETLRSRTEAMRVAYGGDEIQITVSVGVALGIVGDDLRPLQAASDAAVYAAKQRGRNRVVFADELPPDAPRKRELTEPVQRA